LLGEQHLRHVVTEYAAHYLAERNHQGLAHQPISTPAAANDNGNSQVRCRRRLGGLLKYWANEAV
jgi:putative transposase